jgi:hypothetical protein
MFAKVQDLEYECRIGHDEICRQNDDGGKKTTPYGATIRTFAYGFELPKEGEYISKEPDDDEIQRKGVASTKISLPRRGGNIKKVRRTILCGSFQ